MTKYRIAFALPAAVVVAALAAPGFASNRTRPGGNATATATASITASPNPAPAGGSPVDVSGCGYRLQPAEVHIVHSAGYTEIYSVTVWRPGCFSGTFKTQEAGTYRIDVYQNVSLRKARQGQVMVASTSLTVR